MATKQIETDYVGIALTEKGEQIKKIYFHDIINEKEKELIYWYRSNARIFISNEAIKKIGVDLTLDSHYANANIEIYNKDFFTQKETTSNIKGTIKYGSSEYSYNSKKYRKFTEIALFTGNTYRFTPVLINPNNNSFVVLESVNLGNLNYQISILETFEMTMGVIRDTIVSDSTNPNINIFLEEAYSTKRYKDIVVDTNEYMGLDNEGYELYTGTIIENIGKYRTGVSVKFDEFNQYGQISYNFETGEATIKGVSRTNGGYVRGQITYNSYGNI